MARLYEGLYNLLVISDATRETAINTQAVTSANANAASMLVSADTIINLTPRRETNTEELTGLREADRVYNLGNTSAFTMNFPKAQPQHFAAIIAYAFGSASNPGGSSPFTHTLTPNDDLMTPYTFTGVQRYGKAVDGVSATSPAPGIAKRRHYSLGINSFTARFPSDDWISISADVVGTGKFDDTVIEEDVTVGAGVTTATLTTSAQGTTAATRLESIYIARIQRTAEPTEWQYLTPLTFSNATLALTWTESSNAGTLRVLMNKKESSVGSWAGTFAARIDEPPLRTSDIQFVFDGTWDEDNSAWVGGKTVTTEFKSIEWTFNNNIEVRFTPTSTSGQGDYANFMVLGAREQTLRFDRHLVEWFLQNELIKKSSTGVARTFGMRIRARTVQTVTGTTPYEVDIIFPRLALTNVPVALDGRLLGESAEIAVLEDADATWSARVKVINGRSTYAN